MTQEKPQTQDEESQISEEIGKEEVVETTQTGEQNIQSISYKPLTLNIDTSVKWSGTKMEYAHITTSR